MLGLLVRLSEAVTRFAQAADNLGIVSSGRIILARLTPSDRETVLSTTGFGKVVWRSKGDWGALTHLYTRQLFLNTGADPVRVIIDAGANIGMESLRFAKLYPEARIIALEANVENARILRANIEGKAAISVLDRGLWNKTAKLRVARRGDDNQSFFVEELPHEAAEFDIEAVSVGELLAMFGLTEIDIFKIDIEGAEMQLFDDSCDGWLSAVRAFIVECPDADAPGATQKIYEAFRRNGIAVCSYIHGENLVMVRAGLGWRPESVLHYPPT